MSSSRADMFTEIEADPRTDAPPRAGELETLSGFLHWHRETLQLKCADLDPAQLAARSVEPSTMSLLGLVRHLTEVERGWFRRFMAGEDAPLIYCSADAPDGDFDGAVPDAAVVAEAWENWRAEAAFTDAFIQRAGDLDLIGQGTDRHRGKMSLRWVLLHLIEEYARHNGHADLLRERVDGRIGQ